MRFRELGVIPPILKALELQGYQQPTPIQEQAIPPVLAGRDVLGCAQTGTGKTAAFAVPILQNLRAHPLPQGTPRCIRALVLTPTRELALQIQESFTAYGQFLPLRCCVIFGGVSQKPQEQELRRGVDVLVATPGRLNDLIGQGLIRLDHLEIFVLDEADRMLDMGFIHDVRRVIRQLPDKKQTLLFSATMPKEIAEIARTVLVNPAKIAVAPVSSTVDSIEQSVYFVDKANKRKLLIHLLGNPEIVSALVFTRTKHGADRVTRELTRAGIKAAAIHGDKSQGARQRALSSFKDGSVRVLVATDIAARGIDIVELSHVINFDLPNIPETYVHRIGRTGRAGLSGVAISFCDEEEKAYLADIRKLTKRDIPVVEGHPYPLGSAPTPEPSLSAPAAKSAVAAPDRVPSRRQPKKQKATDNEAEDAPNPPKRQKQNKKKGEATVPAAEPAKPASAAPQSSKKSDRGRPSARRRRPPEPKVNPADEPVTRNAYFMSPLKSGRPSRGR
ncbi:DEAD/DEAH box helicase [Clostridiaceae bacterium NSJ-31]|uniref:ATP-dependent RNA helicase CshA n=1 Tax=Ligaoa zhengdingensis TaxID=2763658 RepID=A0A926DYQ3_9FIRM|nr:DEAD/DEAH box helicase [Ligaoa zhengdingensis]MBC8545894.1 DEAD/DEAH box helicase [Ligaoa zhengdingensis]